MRSRGGACAATNLDLSVFSIAGYRLRRADADTIASTPRQLGAFVDAELKKWVAVIQAGVKAE